MRRLAPVLALLALLAVNLRWAEPYYNWDMLGYMGVAYRWAGASAEEAHRRTYELVDRIVPPAQHAWLVAAGPFQQTVAADPVAFDQQLPFYRVKPAYPLLIRALDALGLDALRASVWISRVAYAGIGIVVLVWLLRFLSPAAALATTWAVMSVQVVLEAGQLSTPDALSALVVVAALYTIFERQRFRTGLLLLLLSIAVRPDNLLWLMLGSGYVALRGRHQRLVAGGAAAAGAAAYAGLVAWSGNLGWRVMFHHAFIELLPYPAAHTPSLGPGGYAWIYLRETHPANLPYFAALFALIGAWLLVTRLRRHGWADPGAGLLAAAGLFAAGHWFAFPNEDRMLLSAYVVLLILLVRMLAESAARPAELGAAGGQAQRAVHVIGIPRLDALIGRVRARPGS